MDNKGSESDKIDDALASLRLLNSEIHVAVASITVIAREINVLRDDKLFSELNKLIEGYVTLSYFFYYLYEMFLLSSVIL